MGARSWWRHLHGLLPGPDDGQSLALLGELAFQKILPLLCRLILVQDLLRLELVRLVASLRVEMGDLAGEHGEFGVVFVDLSLGRRAAQLLHRRGDLALQRD